MESRNDKPRVYDCKETLKFLDYLRKSQCTHASGNGQDPKSSIGCTKALDMLETAAKLCMERTGFKPG